MSPIPLVLPTPPEPPSEPSPAPSPAPISGVEQSFTPQQQSLASQQHEPLLSGNVTTPSGSAPARSESWDLQPEPMLTQHEPLLAQQEPVFAQPGTTPEQAAQPLPASAQPQPAAGQSSPELPPGPMPAPSRELAPEPVSSLEEQSAPAEVEDYDEDFEATVVRPRSGTETQWKLIDLDGTAYALHLSNVFGRKPSPKDAPEKAQLVSLSDAERVLSRTHALLEVDGDILYVTDLASTNGTELLDADGSLLLECEPNVRTTIPAGGSLSLGGRAVTFAQ